MLVNRACTATDLKKTTRQRSLKNEDEQNQLWGSHCNYTRCNTNSKRISNANKKAVSLDWPNPLIVR